MKYYKVMKDNIIIDVLNCIRYVKYNIKHNRMFNCTIQEAEAILSSDGKHAWHINTLRKIPVGGFDTVVLEEISESEYEQLKKFNCSTPDELIDSFVMELIESGVL